ncbi:MAG: TIGR02147 family protein [Chitinivibrionales bacterium]|nr:TIGR02147 family protein [Chitinivibrionales bacterium]
MISIFDFSDPMEYLNAVIEEKRRQSNGCTLRSISNKLGYKSSASLSLILRGKMRISERTKKNLITYLKLNKAEAEYFLLLVCSGQAENPLEKQALLASVHEKQSASPRAVHSGQYSLYSKWYLNALRNVLTYIDVKKNYRQIAGHFSPPLTTEQVKQGLQQLLRLDLIHRDKKGFLRPKDRLISTTKKGNLEKMLRRYHTQSLELGKKAVKKVPDPYKQMSTLTVSLSAGGLHKALDTVGRCRKKILKIVEEEKNANATFHFIFNTFPVTKFAHPNQDSPT